MRHMTQQSTLSTGRRKPLQHKADKRVADRQANIENVRAFVCPLGRGRFSHGITEGGTQRHSVSFCSAGCCSSPELSVPFDRKALELRYVLRIVCRLVGHKRSRRRARPNAGTWRSECIFCATPLVRVRHRVWVPTAEKRCPRDGTRAPLTAERANAPSESISDIRH